MQNKLSKSGFTLLMALLTVSVILVVAMGVSSIILKEIKLSGLVRNSQIAFYYADSGSECILYWDLKEEDQFDYDAAEDNFPYDISCFKLDKDGVLKDDNNDTIYDGEILFNIDIDDDDNDRCVKITVKKDGPNNKTIIESKGYSAGCGSNDPNKVERAVRLTY